MNMFLPIVNLVTCTNFVTVILHFQFTVLLVQRKDYLCYILDTCKKKEKYIKK